MYRIHVLLSLIIGASKRSTIMTLNDALQANLTQNKAST